ncbi:MAG: nucleotidyltransferase family protein, partial [Clostridia bacterium]|nr:nucleotidyltransferase family protein [Clostridia bacterium]
MNFCGIVCEFNPFHNGHEYIINEAKKQSGSEILCLMSGNFVQRGTPAIESKYERAKKAITAGANAVLELPTIYACSNAENFAFGSIKIFKALGINKIAFGIENTSLETLKQVAKLKFENSERFQTAFKNEIQNGINYNTALKRSISSTLGDDGILEVLNKPNNILAIEYLTAMLKLNHDMQIFAINRTDNGYVSKTNKNQFLSATAIRSLILENKNHSEFVPDFALVKKPFNSVHTEIFEKMTILKLKQTPVSSLSKIYDYTEGIEYRIKKITMSFGTLDEITNNVASPRYRVPRVQKLLLYPLLEITQSAVKLAEKTKPVVKVIAISKSNKTLLSSYNKKKISLIATNNDYNSLSPAQN